MLCGGITTYPVELSELSISKGLEQPKVALFFVLAHDLPNILPCRRIFSPLPRDSMETGVATYPRPTAGTIKGAPTIQTPSRAKYGPGGRFNFSGGVRFTNLSVLKLRK